MRTCKIRQADSTDSDSVAEVFDAAFARVRTIYRPIHESVDRHVRPSGALRIIAELPGRIVGTVEVDRHPHYLRLIGLAVHPEFQRLGIGREIVEWIGANLTARTIELATIRETGNVPVFERMGFGVIEEKVADWCVSNQFERLHEVTMAKAIASQSHATEIDFNGSWL